MVNTRSHTLVCDQRRQVEQLFKQQASYIQTVYVVLININREVTLAVVYGSTFECVPGEEQVISTLIAGDGYFLWFH